MTIPLYGHICTYPFVLCLGALFMGSYTKTALIRVSRININGWQSVYWALTLGVTPLPSKALAIILTMRSEKSLMSFRDRGVSLVLETGIKTSKLDDFLQLTIPQVLACLHEAHHWLGPQIDFIDFIDTGKRPLCTYKVSDPSRTVNHLPSKLAYLRCLVMTSQSQFPVNLAQDPCTLQVCIIELNTWEIPSQKCIGNPPCPRRPLQEQQMHVSPPLGAGTALEICNS